MPLEALIEFLFQNVFFVILVIGGLISLFKRMGTANDQQEKRKKLHPLPPVAKPVETPLKRNKEDTVSVSKSEDMMSKHSTEHTAPSTVQIEPIDVGRVPPSKHESPRVNAKKANADMLRRLTKRQVAEGIIWAEILGAPRAKRPYTPKNRIR